MVGKPEPGFEVSAWHCLQVSTPPTVLDCACSMLAPVAWQPRHAAWIGGVDGSPAEWAVVFAAWRMVAV